MKIVLTEGVKHVRVKNKKSRRCILFHEKGIAGMVVFVWCTFIFLLSWGRECAVRFPLFSACFAVDYFVELHLEDEG